MIMCGLPGTGKSFVADVIARKTGAEVLRTDDVRKEYLQGRKPSYSEEERQGIYELMFRKAKGLLDESKDVILDATFAKKNNRARAVKESGTDKIVMVEVVLEDEEVIKKRIEKRLMGGRSKSDATYQVYKRYKHGALRFDRISSDELREGMRHIVINNSGKEEETEKQVKKIFEELCNQINTSCARNIYWNTILFK
jgi:predicted kinase